MPFCPFPHAQSDTTQDGTRITCCSFRHAWLLLYCALTLLTKDCSARGKKESLAFFSVSSKAAAGLSVCTQLCKKNIKWTSGCVRAWLYDHHKWAIKDVAHIPPAVHRGTACCSCSPQTSQGLAWKISWPVRARTIQGG